MQIGCFANEILRWQEGGMCVWSVALERLGGYKEVWFHSLSVLLLH